MGRVISKKTKKPNKPSLLETHPDLCKEWDYDLNEQGPEWYTAGSGMKVHWICPNEHKYASIINGRTNRSSGCQQCVGNILTDKNCLSAINPDALKMWDYGKNTITPFEVTKSSQLKVWWLCPFGHSFDALICNIVKRNGCPGCSGKRVYLDNCLATTHPHIAAEWDFALNEQGPDKYTFASHHLAHWICPYSHKYSAMISKRAHSGHGCSFCCGQKASPETCISYTNPEIMAEWDYERNTILPTTISYGSERLVHWICSDGHKYEMCPYQKIQAGIGCPKCSKRTSVCEKLWLDTIGLPDDTEHRQITLRCNGKKYFVDGYEPSTATVYEFDGDYFHGNPFIYNQDVINPTTKTTFGTLYNKTIEKQNVLKKAGFIVNHIWDSEFILTLEPEDIEDNNFRNRIKKAKASYNRHIDAYSGKV